PGVEQRLGFFTRVDLGPGDLLLAAELLRHRGVEHAHAGAPDVGAGSVALDERDDRAIGHFEGAVGADGDRFGAGGDDGIRAGRVRHLTAADYLRRGALNATKIADVWQAM